MNESEFLISAHLQLYATFNLFFGLTSIIFLVKSVCKFFFFFFQVKLVLNLMFSILLQKESVKLMSSSGVHLLNFG